MEWLPATVTCRCAVVFERWVTSDQAEYQENYGAWESDLITTARNTGLDSSQVRGLRDAAIALGQEVGYRGRPAADVEIKAVLDRYRISEAQRPALVKLAFRRGRRWRTVIGRRRRRHGGRCGSASA